MPYIVNLAIAVAAILVATKALGWLAARFGQPAIVGEIVAGIVLGGSALSLINPRDPILHALSQAGVLLLLFEAGLHTEPSALRRAGAGSIAVAAVGAIVPFLSGYFIARWMGANWLESTVVGGAMSATSAGISARVLSNFGLLESEEERIMEGAAVIDDVIGLAILASVMALVTSDSRPMELILRTLLFPTAFVGGLVIDAKGLNGKVDRITTKLVWLIAPFFAAVTGALADLRAMTTASALGFAGALIAFGIAGKMISGWATPGFRGNKLLIGAAMVPRGEMGLIFAQMGLIAFAIDRVSFGAILLMVLATTLVTPPMLTAIARRTPAPQVT
jgi:Kef-type K+ transport system membrane component KefB